jgi:RNA-directed DNA polymerase
MRYKVYTIKKRNGRGVRTIAQPTPGVKELQRWAVANILSQYPVHDSATAYKKGSSILENATPHKRNSYLLKLDFENFFNSITSEDLLAFLSDRQSNLDTVDREHLCRILFWRKKGTTELILSIGAPSSPTLSNILLYDLDCAIASHCSTDQVAYTRYADDLTFSCKEPGRLQRLEETISLLLADLRYPRLTLNTQKTVNASKKSRRRVTGLVITNDAEVSLGRDRKRILRAMVHRYVQGQLDIEGVMSLRGWLAYVNVVEPSFLERLRNTYGTEALTALGGFWKMKD